MTKTKALAKPKKESLGPQRELFCKLYATDFDFIGNGVRSYMKAYPDSTYAAARTGAHRLLTNANILARINELLEKGVLSDAFVDTQLAFLVTQNADFSAKMAAIREYNALKKRIAGSRGQINFIQLILKKWGLDNVEAIDWNEDGVPQDRA